PEQGFPDTVADNWYGLLAPAKTPSAVVAKLHDAVVAVLETPDVREKLLQSGAVPAPTASAEFGKILSEELARWGRIGRGENIKEDWAGERSGPRAAGGLCCANEFVENVVSKLSALLSGLIAIAVAQTAAAETLKVAVAQRGFWNSTFIEVGLKQGYFREVGLDIDILYTEGGASTLTPVIAGSMDIAMTNGILGVVAAYAKGMPVKIISAEATGAAEAFWYARPESGIRRLAETDGKTVAYSSPGS